MTKKVLLSVATLALVLVSTSCKPKESAYKAAYEKAKQREVAAAATKPASDEVVPVVVPAEPEADVRSERVTPAAGEDANGLKAYSVVIGSFQNVTNARSLKERMAKNGYNPVLAQNEEGLYRVIVTSFDNKEDAIRSREAIKSMFAPLFADAWLLYRTY
ncbi:MAG: SPOR domain-containing protein [Porphyromonas sp.]|nr:SPOR domain-containing protein [Porphyromonas sp.]